MAFLDNTGLERLWQHICDKFSTQESIAATQYENILDNSCFWRAVKRREDFQSSTSITIHQGSGSASGGSGGSGGGSAGGGGSTSAGATTSVSSMSYKFDRWRVSSSITQQNGVGLTIPTGVHYFRQGLELDTFQSCPYTLVLTFGDGTKVGGVIDLTGVSEGSLTDGMVTFAVVKAYNSTYDKIDITINNTSGQSVVIKSVAMYEANLDFLPTYRPKSRQEEQLHAARFFKQVSGTGLACRTVSAAAHARIIYEIPFRTNSYSLIVVNKGNIYGNSKAADVAVTGVTLSSAGIDGVLLYAQTAANSLTSNGIGVWTNGKFGLDADYT